MDNEVHQLQRLFSMKQNERIIIYKYIRQSRINEGRKKLPLKWYLWHLSSGTEENHENLSG
jgi:hypothetical protein